jgi:8-oxo-dGTP pyrophosphatase MutT (NUDIX family)
MSSGSGGTAGNFLLPKTPIGDTFQCSRGELRIYTIILASLARTAPSFIMTAMHAQESHGVINHDGTSTRKTDYLYRISLKCLVQNADGKVLVVKETGRTWWDLPGGGMDHGEGVRAAIAREMKEEVNLSGDFTYKIIDVDEPAHLSAHNFWQLRLVFAIKPSNLGFSPGEDGDEVAFMDPQSFEKSDSEIERRIFRYSQLLSTASSA